MCYEREDFRSSRAQAKTGQRAPSQKTPAPAAKEPARATVPN